jgi:hypothetical protein
MALPKLVRRALMTAALAGGGLGAFALAPTPAQAIQTPQHYQLTPREQHNACGRFIGPIIFFDGTSLDCSTGIATLY